MKRFLYSDTEGRWVEDPHGAFVMHAEHVEALERLPRAPIPIRLACPGCLTIHVDEGEWATRPHHTHACQECGMVWRPAVVDTVGVEFLPGFKS